MDGIPCRLLEGERPSCSRWGSARGCGVGDKDDAFTMISELSAARAASKTRTAIGIHSSSWADAGKTETARALREFIVRRRERMCHRHEQYMEKHTVARSSEHRLATWLTRGRFPDRGVRARPYRCAVRRDQRGHPDCSTCCSRSRRRAITDATEDRRFQETESSS